MHATSLAVENTELGSDTNREISAKANIREGFKGGSKIKFGSKKKRAESSQSSVPWWWNDNKFFQIVRFIFRPQKYSHIPMHFEETTFLNLWKRAQHFRLRNNGLKLFILVLYWYFSCLLCDERVYERAG